MESSVGWVGSRHPAASRASKATGHALRASGSTPQGTTGLVALVALALLLPNLSHSDSREDWKRKPPGRFHINRFWVTPRLELRNAGVDTNVYNDLRNPIPDTSVVLRPGLRVALPVGRRIRLQGSGFIDLNYFQRETTERSTDFGLNGRGDIDVGPFTFYGGGGGGQARQRQSIDLDERLLKQEQFGFGGVDLRVGRATELRGRVDVRSSRFEPSRLGAEVQRALDRDSRTGRAELRYDLTALTTLSASAEVIEDTFVHQRDLARLTRSYRILGGFDFAEKALLSGSARVGLRQIPGSSAGTVPSYSGPAFKLETTARIRSSARLRLAADGDVYFALSALPTVNDRLRNSYVSRGASAGIDLDLPLGLIARAGVAVQRAEYLAAYVVDQRIARRADQVQSFDAALLRRIGDSLRVGGSGTFTRRVSNLPGFSYEGWRYGLSAEIAP
jgi:hypothetical protein